MERRDNRRELQAKIERVMGPCSGWGWDKSGVRFKVNAAAQSEYSVEPITLKKLQDLADAVGTDAINFNLGWDGEPGYSSYTPGCSGNSGWIQILIET
jgi:hypothetical protein